MGLAKAAVHLLMIEAARRPFSGRIVTLGRQHVYVTAAETQSLAQRAGITLRPLPVELHREPSLAAQGFVSDDWLLTSLGFDEVVRVDYSNYEQVEVELDLNHHETPTELRAAFDVVLDSGTLEHVFDIAAGLRHCVRLVKEQGRIIHLTPSSNCVEHGFYSVSPTLFADFYAASGFDINRVWLCETPIDLPRGDWNVYDYLSSNERFIALGQLTDQIWFTYSVATAGPQVSPKTPQQSFYTSTWKASTQQTAEAQSEPHEFEPGSKSQRLLELLKRFPGIQRQTAAMIQRWRKHKYQQSIRSHKLPYPYVGKF